MLKYISFISFATMLSTSVFASPVQYVEGDKSVETKVCAMAANDGLAAARKLAQQHGIEVSRFSPSIVCNGEDIRTFAAQVVKVEEVVERKVQLVAKNSTDATALCLEAAQKGLKAERITKQVKRNLQCNDLPVRQFVKKYHAAI